MRLYLLGSPRLELEGESVHLPRRKATALLAYLSVTGRAHSRDSLATLLWPENDQRSARAELSRTLSLLNRILGQETLVADRATVGLNPDLDLWLDTAAFRDRLAVAAEPSGDADALPPLVEAVELYRDDFLAGFTLRDSAQFDEWQTFETQSLRDELAGALERLAQIYVQQQEFEQAISYARRWLSLDPLHEPAHRALMRLYAQSGQRAAALRQYEECERILQQELGVAPQEETQRAYRAIVLWPGPGEATAAQTIRGYELRERIGEGAFGEVYRGYQPSVGREVAIKVIAPDLANQPEFIRRFEAEAHLVARLEHPHIVPLYDYWREPEGAYLVMRWLRGGDLHQALQSGPWTPEDAARLLDQIAGALAIAHRQGVVHRDVKPENIMLDEQGNAYLTDFGIAKDLSHSSGATQTGALIGSPAYVSPEQAQSRPLTPGSDLYSLGVVMYETLTAEHPYAEDSLAAILVKHLTEPLPPLSLHRPDLPPVLEAGLSAVLERATAKDPSQRYPDVLAFAAAFRRALSGLQAPAATAPAEAELELLNPYKGLRPFEEADAADFYGRRALVERLLGRLSPRQEEERSGPGERFLAVVGPSGSGKSSVVQAGLVPALRRGALPGSERWYIVEVLPGAHPLDELEIGLLRVSAAQPAGLMEQLKRDERGLLRAAQLILPAEEGELLLIIDQFEELYTRAEDEGEREHFLQSLHAAATDPRSRVRVLVTLRADFYDRPLTHPLFGELMRRQTEVVLPLSAQELAEAIREPAERAGAELEPGLVAAVVADVSEQPGALPMLQYALTELFERREGRTLTLGAYREIGGVSGALARRAEEVYAALDASGQAAARQLYLRLVTLGESASGGPSSPDTRRRVLRSELEAVESLGATPSVLEEVLNAFGRSRLLLFDRDPATRVPTVEVAHEALLLEWARLREWLDENWADVRLLRLLAASAQEWLQAGSDPSFLLRGTRLAQFEGWAEPHAAARTVALTHDERAYLEASLADREARQAEQEARRQRELEAERQRTEEQARSAARLRQRNRIISAVGLVALVALVVAILALTQVGQTSRANADLAAAQATVAEENVAIARTAQAANTVVAEQRDQARRQARVVLAQSLAGLAPRLDKDDGLAALLAVEAYNIVGSPPGAAKPGAAGPTGSAGAMIDAALREILSRPAFAVTLPGHESVIMELAFSPDGRWLASGSLDSTARLWSLAAGPPGQGSHRLDHEGVVNAVAFSPDGSLLATGGSGATIQLWSPADPEATPQVLPGQESGVRRYGIAFSPDGRRLVTVGQDGTVRLWDLGEARAGDSRSPLPQALYTGPSLVRAVAFSPDGRLLVVSGPEGLVYLWETDDLSVPPRAFRSAETEVLDLAFSPDGRWLACASADGSVRLWDVARASGAGVPGLVETSQVVGQHEGWANSVAWSPDGRWLASTGRDNLVRLWDLAEFPNAPAGAAAAQAVRGHVLQGTPDLPLNAVAFSPDGRWVAAAGEGQSIWLWDVSTLLNTSVSAMLDTSRSHLVPAGGRLLHESDVRLTSVAWSAVRGNDAAWLAAGGYNRELYLWPLPAATGEAAHALDEVETLGEPRLLPGHMDSARTVALSPDGRWLASGSDDHTMRIWLLDNVAAQGDAAQQGGASEPLALYGHEDSVISLAFTERGQWLASGSLDRTVRLWALDDRGGTPALVDRPTVLGPLPAKVTAVALDANGQWLAAGSVDGTIRVWPMDGTSSTISPSAEPRLLAGGAAVRALVLARDGRWLVSGDAYGAVHAWELEQSTGPIFLGAHEAAVTHIATSDDGRWLASAGADRSVHLWDLGTSRSQPDWAAEARVLSGHKDAVTSVAFSESGRRLISVSLDGTLRLWVVPLEELVDLACRRARRNMTSAEWQSYLPGQPYRKTCAQWPLQTQGE